MISGRGGSMMRGGRIRPPRRAPLAPPGTVDEFEHCWEKLRDALRDIHMRNAGDLSFEQLYRYSYKIVLRKAGQKLYDRVKEFEEKWFADQVLPPIWALITPNLVSLTLEQAPDENVMERRAMGEKFLKGIRSSWVNHDLSMNMIADILMYLERGNLKGNERPTIYTAAIGLFRDHILRNTVVEQNGSTHLVFEILTTTIIDHINMERTGDAIDKALLRNCTSMLEYLFETDDECDGEQLYLTSFEPTFLQRSEDFYRAEAAMLVRNNDASTWLRHTQRRLNEEATRCRTTLSPLSLRKISEVIERELIVNLTDEFFTPDGSGVNAMIDNDRFEDLTILYQLISLVDTNKSVLRNALSSRVIKLGKEIEQALQNTDFSVAQQADAEQPVDGTEKPKPKSLNAAAQLTAAAIKWVDDVLLLKDKFDRLWSTCFSEDFVMQTALTRSFSEFINSFGRSAEFVSLFIDDNLKRGIRGKTEDEVDAVLEKAITLLRYLGDKFKFEQYYQKHLARRLLHDKSESEEVEQEMISRMKRELGNNFTQKFEGMFRDMRTSKETSEQYRDHIRGLGEVDEKRIELSIRVLAGNNWPKEVMGRTALPDGQSAKIHWPRDIQGLQDSFFKFYTRSRNGRVLTWLGGPGTADIKCVFPKIAGKTSGPLSRERRYELNVSTYGMVVLLLFNDLAEDEWLSFEEIQGQTNIPQVELINVLTSLSVIKTYRVLMKEPQSKAAAKPGDRFTFNREFMSKAIKIKVPSVNAANKVETEEERKVTEMKNDETRNFVTDAALVRIMKQRKELAHTQLINEVIQVLASRFKPDIALIKRRIETLITREYLDRAELADGTPTYLYVA
ncbi:putative cullulin 3 [Hypoxylon sp. NC1633]|nr:putative cullulin 3 [Hypoxylon sp. NC1633]